MIALASDHAGFGYKQKVKKYLDEKGIAYRDYGCPDESSCNYAEYGYLAAKAVSAGECEKGIIICGTGIGISIAANKVNGIRAALCHDVFSAKATRMHNNANILAMGARVIGEGLMFEIIDAFLSTDFEGGRHEARIARIHEIEKQERS